MRDQHQISLTWTTEEPPKILLEISERAATCIQVSSLKGLPQDPLVPPPPLMEARWKAIPKPKQAKRDEWKNYDSTRPRYCEYSVYRACDSCGEHREHKSPVFLVCGIALCNGCVDGKACLRHSDNSIVALKPLMRCACTKEDMMDKIYDCHLRGVPAHPAFGRTVTSRSRSTRKPRPVRW